MSDPGDRLKKMGRAERSGINASALGEAVVKAVSFATAVEEFYVEMENVGYTQREVRLVLIVLLKLTSVGMDGAIDRAREILLDQKMKGNF